MNVLNIDKKTVPLSSICKEPLSYGMGASAIAYDGTTKYLRITDIDDNTHKFLNDSVTSPDEIADSKYILGEGDIVFARTGASVGKTYLYNEDDGRLAYAGFLVRARLDNSKIFDNNFVYFQTFTNRYNKWVKVMSTRSGQPGINADEYSKLPITLTNKENQKFIGSLIKNLYDQINCLNEEIEEWITLKNTLIEKLIYKANYEKKAIFKMIEKKHQYINEYSNYLEISDIDVKTKNYFLDLNKELAPGARKADCGCILVSTVRPTRGAISILKSNCFVSGALLQLYPNSQCNRDYLFYSLCSYRILNKMGAFSTGSTYPTIDKDDILKFEIPFPDLKTQTFIAEELNKICKILDIKNEIKEALEERFYSLVNQLY